MILALDSGCAAGIAILAAGAAALLAVTTWPAYVLGVLRVAPETSARIERAVARTSVVLFLAALAGALFLALHGC